MFPFRVSFHLPTHQHMYLQKKEEEIYKYKIIVKKKLNSKSNGIKK